MHPDGSYGGEYGSRNTHLFFPHGFELMSERIEEAALMTNLYAKGMRNDRRVHLDDDRMCAHLTYNHLQAYLDSDVERETERSIDRPKQNRYWKKSRLYIRNNSKYYCVISGAKGGVIRLYDDERLAYADSGLIARLDDGSILVTHLPDEYRVELEDDRICIEGRFGKAKHKLPNPLTQAVFHVGMFVMGRWGSDLVRSILQKILIVGKKKSDVSFQRTVIFSDRVTLIDEIRLPDNSKNHVKVSRLFAGTDHTSIYVAVSRSYQQSSLFPWTDLNEHLDELNEKGRVRIERVIG